MLIFQQNLCVLNARPSYSGRFGYGTKSPAIPRTALREFIRGCGYKWLMHYSTDVDNRNCIGAVTQSNPIDINRNVNILPDNRPGSQTSRMFDTPYTGKYVSLAILCQTYGLAQMKKLPNLPMFCLVCQVGPALNDNTPIHIRSKVFVLRQIMPLWSQGIVVIFNISMQSPGTAMIFFMVKALLKSRHVHFCKCEITLGSLGMKAKALQFYGTAGTILSSKHGA